jgi:hypothetical protein
MTVQGWATDVTATTVGEVREFLLERVRAVVERTGMFGTTPAEIEGAFYFTLSDLFFIDGRHDEWHRKLRFRAAYPYGNRGVAAIEDWFEATPGTRRLGPEVAAEYAEFCNAHGYLDVDARLDDSQWSELGLDDPTSYTQRDWTRDEIDEHLPEPSLRVDKSTIYCFAHRDPSKRWVFFDFERLFRPGVTTRLRSIRTSAPRSGTGFTPTPLGRSGLILTPLGRSTFTGG